MKINQKDLDFTSQSVSIYKITEGQLNDNQLNELEDYLTEAGFNVDWANTEEMGYLVISFRGWINSTRDIIRDLVCEKLSQILKNKKTKLRKTNA